MEITRATQVTLEGRGMLTLNPADHMATGGEASIYRRGNTVIKLYKQPDRLQRDGMMDRVRRLCAFRHQFVVAPQGFVLNSNGTPIGLYLDFVDGEALSRVFTNDFRLKYRFGDREASLLVDRMFQVMAFAHGQRAIMIDPNELNWTTVLGSDGRNPRILDVDSWTVDGRIPSTYWVMPSIRDWHSKQIGPETDRFALAVVTFQVYTGIHPYKGTLAGYKPMDLTKRMQNQASVFAKGVRLNTAVRDFGCIPGPLYDWYRATFETGDRSEPPSPFARGLSAPSGRVRIARTMVTSAGTLRYEKLFEAAGDPTIRCFPCGTVRLRSGRLIDLATQRVIAPASTDNCEVIRADQGWIVAEQLGSTPRFTFVNGTSLVPEPLGLRVPGQLVRSENRLFLANERGLTELVLRHFASTMLTLGNTWGAMFNSTRWLDGVGVQDAFGATYLILPFGDDACAQVRVRELDGLRPVAARAGNRFVALVCVDKTGAYTRFELSFDRAYRTYTVQQGSADSPELNMAVLPRGVAATIVHDGELVVFVPSSGTVNRVPDKDVSTDMLLYNWGDRVIFLRHNAVWSVRMS